MFVYIYVCKHVYEHKNVYLCTKMCMCIFLIRRKNIYGHCLFFLLSLSLPGVVYVRAFQAVPLSPHVLHSSSSESQASCHLVPTSFLGPLPSLSLCLDFFLAQLALTSFLMCEILSRQKYALLWDFYQCFISFFSL